MSVQCPHCGGDFQVELTLSVPAVKHVVLPVAPMPASQSGLTSKPVKAPKFMTHTDAGLLRLAVYNAGYPKEAKDATIFNDQRVNGRRLKMWTRISRTPDTEHEAIVQAITNVFGDRINRVAISDGTILVYLHY